MLNLFSLSFLPSHAASRIRYEITSGNIGGAFAVKNMTGAIYVAGALDYETRKRVSTEAFLFLFNETKFQVFLLLNEKKINIFYWKQSPRKFIMQKIYKKFAISKLKFQF